MPMTQAAYRRNSASGEFNIDNSGGHNFRLSRFDALSICSTSISRLSNAVSLWLEGSRGDNTDRQVTGKYP